MSAYTFDGQTIERNGQTYKVSIHYDEDLRTPWEEHDGHGEVSEWTTRDKMPSERVLCEDCRSHRFYDVAATMKKAKREGWGLGPDRLAKLAERIGRQPVKGDILAEAVRLDFEYLRGWCNDEWHWVWIKVECEESGEYETLGGLESEDEEGAGEAIADMVYTLDRARAIANRFADAMACGI